MDHVQSVMSVLGSLGEESVLPLAPAGAGQFHYLPPLSLLVRAMRAYRPEEVARISAAYAASGKPVPGARVVLYAAHSEADLSPLKEMGVRGYEGRVAEFKMGFLNGFGGIADLSSAEFEAGDDFEYCMTFGRLAGHLRRFHGHLAGRAHGGYPVGGARLLVATHLVLLDSWQPSADLWTVLSLYDALASYGCALPRLVHAGSGPWVARKGLPGPSPAWGARESPRLLLSWAEGETCRLPEDIGALVGVGAEILLRAATEGDYGIASGAVYVVVPDALVGRALRAHTEPSLALRNWTYDPNERGMRVVLVEAGRLKGARLERPDMVVVFPVVRGPAGYSRMEPYQLAAVVGALPTFYTTATRPLRLTVVSRSSPEHAPVDVRAFLEAHPCDPRTACGAHVRALPLQEQVRAVCQLSAASYQAGGACPEAAREAARAGMLECAEKPGEAPRVLRILPEGLFCAKSALDPELTRFLVAWGKTRYKPFPAFCLVAILERSRQGRTPLVVADNETVRRIAQEEDLADPAAHQLMAVVEYIKEFRLELVNKERLVTLAGRYGIDAVALLEVMSRIINLRASFVTASNTYGPFGPRELAAALAETGMFPVANYQASAGNDGSLAPAFVIGKEVLRNHLPKDSPYPVPQNILVLHAESDARSSGWEKNSVPTRSTILYAAC